MAGAGARLSVANAAFCDAYMRLQGNASEAYGEAFPNSKPENRRVYSYRLLRNPNVATRIAEMKEALAKEHSVTIADIAKQLDEDRTFAKESGQAGAMVRATEAKGKLYGLMVDKHDHNMTMRPDDARQIIAQLAAKYLPGNDG